MAYTLIIDTSAGTSVALTSADKALAEFNDPSTMRHAEGIGAAISQVLAEAGIRPKDVTSVVVGRGPAPFTGLRVGIAAAIMFAQGAGAKLFGVVSLDAIALDALSGPELTKQVSAETPLLVTADARRQEVYWALYSGLSKSGAPVCIEGPGVIKPAALAELMAERGSKHIQVTSPVFATRLGQVFESKLLDGSASHDVTALYLREPDAVPTSGKKVSG